MEERKQKEAQHYNKKVQEQLSANNLKGDFEGFDSFVLASFKFLKEKTNELIKNKKVLDYGCGNGVHTGWLAEEADRIVAIDISQQSLDIAKRRVKKENAEFLVMDCENLKFENNSFDVVFD